MIVAAFDFDGTLTRKDTFLEFIKHTHGKAKFWCGFLLMSPVLVAYKTGIIPNYRAKQIVFSHFFKGWRIDAFDEKAKSFAGCVNTFLRHDMVDRLRQHIAKGDKVVIISASIDNWVKPWAASVGVGEVAGTIIEVTDGIITGRFSSPNCYGQEKVNRLLALYPNRQDYTLYAYGDSTGDRELLAFADYPTKI